VTATVLAVVALLPSPASADALTDGQWYVDFLRLKAAHAVTQGKGVTVAVIDTGVGQHPDLGGNVLPGKDVQLVPTAPNGREDTFGHGTTMAGLIGAHGQVLGVAPQATILPVKDQEASGFPATTAAAIDWSIKQGAKVICLAEGGKPSTGLEQAVRRAMSADIVVVAAAGNTDMDTVMPYPAAYPGVVAAAGIGRNGKHSAVSLRSNGVVLAAPSDHISSTAPGGKYKTASGTSNSTALIAGAVALVRAKYPELKADEVIHRLTATADDKGPTGRDDEYGYGVINIVKALTADVPPLVAETSAPPSAQAGGGADDNGSGVPVGWIVAGAAVIAALTVLFVLIGRRRRSA
jgi:type VII secretion-associated serine protease mycosin